MTTSNGALYPSVSRRVEVPEESDSVYESGSELSVDVRDLTDRDSSQGPRQVALVRHCPRHGYGFTLRHFIVYPSDEPHVEQNGPVITAPMDTVFVKSVKLGSTAHRAGLQKGDRIVWVNGVSALHLNYTEIVRLIQISGLSLLLHVVPRYDDILQRAFGETAHDPHSNLSMKPSSFSHLPRPQPYRPLDQPLQLQSLPPSTGLDEPGGVEEASIARRRLSTLSLQMPPPGPSAPLDANDPIYSRIRRTVDKKEEFLNRPLWLPEPSAAPVLREYHVSPGRFPCAPWPPGPQSLDETQLTADGGSTADQLPLHRRRARRRELRYRGSAGSTDLLQPFSSRLSKDSSLSLSSSADSLGSLAMPDATAAGRSATDPPSPEYVQYDAMTQVPRAKLPPPEHRTHQVSRRAQQFETGRLDNDVYAAPTGGSYRSELQLLSQHGRRAGVRSRRSEFERDADSDASGTDSDSTCRRVIRGGNRMVIVGGPRLHAEPLYDFLHNRASSPGVSSSRRDSVTSNSSDSQQNVWILADAAGETSHNTTGTVSSSSRPLSKISEAESDEQSPASERKSTSAAAGLKLDEKKVKEEHRKKQLPRTKVQSDAPKTVKQSGSEGALVSPAPGQSVTRPQRPSFLAVTSLHDVTDMTCDYALTPSPDTEGKPLSIKVTSSSTQPRTLTIPTNVVRRSKEIFGDDGSDRCVRRVSYLKATSSDGGHVDPAISAARTTSLRCKPPVSPSIAAIVLPLITPAADVTREGWLHVKLAQLDGKRAADRSWRHLWTVLRGNALCFYRDRKEVNQTPSSLEEQPVNVALSTLDTAEDYTRRKYVFRLLTHSGSEYLLQTDQLLERQAWLQALRPLCAHTLEDSSRTSADSSLLSPIGGKAMKKLTVLRQRSPTGGHLAAIKTPKLNPTPEQSTSPKSKTWKGRMARQLKKIHPGAPNSAQNVPSSPDGSTLGVPLEYCPPSAGNEFVPLLVEMCTGLVEERGLDAVGIYRVPGNNAAIASLSEAINRDVHGVNLQADHRWTDVNVISSLLKSFFRKLPDSPVTSELYPLFIEASKIEDPERRKLQLRRLVSDLPDHNYETLKHLFRHLCRITSHSSTNKMEPKNLAIVFGPTLIRSADDSTSSMVTDMSQQCRIVETLINHCDWFFSSEDACDDVGATEDRISPPPPLPACSPPALSDTSSPPSPLHQSPTRPSPPASPHSLSAVHRVDSHQASTTSMSLTPQDVVSGIIQAATRKQQTQPPSAPNTDISHHGAAHSECNNNRIKAARSYSCGAATCDAVSPRVHVIPVQVPDDACNSQSAPVLDSMQPSSVFHGCTVGEQSALGSTPRLAAVPEKGASVSHAPSIQSAPVDEHTAIPSYTGLSQNTQERIRRFEAETRSMLQREKLREREVQQREAQRARIEREWARAKRDLEQDDFLDELADNPAEIVQPRRVFDYGAAASGSLEDRLSVASTEGPPNTADSLSSGYSTLSSGTAEPRRPLRATPGVTTAAAGYPLHKSHSLSRDMRRLMDGGGTSGGDTPPPSLTPPRPQCLVASSRFYRSPRPVRRGRSAENVATPIATKAHQKRQQVALRCRAFDTHKVAPNGTLRRRSLAAQQPEPCSPCDTPVRGSCSGLAGSESGDLVTSLTRTLDQKLRQLTSSPNSSSGGGGGAPTDVTSPLLHGAFRDPSLHRSPLSQNCDVPVDGGDQRHNRWSLLSDWLARDATTTGSRSPDQLQRVAAGCQTNKRVAAGCQTNKKGMKRNIRELCERFEQRTGGSSDSAGGARRVSGGRSGGSPRGLKRRHTVGGTRDFDRLMQLVLAAGGGGSSSAGGRLMAPPASRPASCLVELDLLPLRPVPLESRV